MMLDKPNLTIPMALFIVTLALYLLTLAPDIIWGDSAKLTLLALDNHVLWSAPMAGHPLHTLIASPLANVLPFESYAVRINFVSALFASLGVALVGWIVFSETANVKISAIAGLALAVSHTFWNYSVIAESYTPTVTLFLCSLALVIQPEQKWRLVLAGLIQSLATLMNVLGVFAIPGLFWIVYKRGGIRSLSYLVAGLTLGGFAYLTIVLSKMDLQQFVLSVGGQASTYMTIPDFFRELLFTAVYAAYQFPSIIGVGICAALLPTHWRHDSFVQGIWISAIGVALFAATYQYQRHFVFLILAYSLMVIIGALTLNKLQLRKWSAATLLCLTILPPVLVYAIAPRVYEGMDLNLLKTRPVPGRDISYFLQPWKNGRTEAAGWAQEFVKAVPSEAVIYADFTLARVLSYRLKTVGDRPDLDMIEVDQWFYDSSPDGLIESIQGSLSENRTVVIAQDFDPIYKTRALREKFHLKEGTLFLEIKPNSGSKEP